MRSLMLSAATLLFAATPALAQTQPAGQAAAAASVDGFARAAAQSSLAEVLMSSMAIQKTGDERVQDFAWTMLDHHARAMGDLAEALSAGAAALPTEPSAEQQATLQRMQGMSGAQFDQMYFAHQLDSHRRAISVYEQGARLPDAKVAGYARSTLPLLQAHQRIAQTKQAEPPQPLPNQ